MPPLIDVREVRLLQGPNRFAPHSVLTCWITVAEELSRNAIEDCGRALDRLLRETFGVQPAEHSEAVESAAPAQRLAHLLGRYTEAWQRSVGQPDAVWQLLPVVGYAAGVAVGYRDAGVVSNALTLSLRLVSSWLVQVRGAAPSPDWLKQVKKNCEAFAQHARAQRLDQTTAALVAAAEARDIPWVRMLPTRRGVVLGQGCRQRRFIETITDQTSNLADRLARDKDATLQLLRGLGIPVPESVLVPSAEVAIQEANRIGWPVVVKPNHLGKGTGVAVKLMTPQAVRTAFTTAAALGPVLVEQFVPGSDHRLLMLHGKLLAAAQRVPACITGDGRRSVQELIAEVNRDPRRGLGFDKPLVRIVIDEEAARILSEQGQSMQSAPAAGQTVWLRRTANIATGGTAIDFTDTIHPDNRRLAERAARAIGLDIAGLDFVTPDLTRSWREVGGAFIEVNASPGLRPHLSTIPPREVTGPIIESYFPASRPARIPTAMVIGKFASAVCRWLALLLAQTGRTVALTTAKGAFVGSELALPGNRADGETASRLLLDPAVEAGVFEMTVASIRDAGLVLDGCTVGALLDAPEPTDEQSTRDALAECAGLIVRHARDWAVVNGDDPFCVRQLTGARARGTCLVTSKPDSEPIQAHRQRGGTVVAVVDPDHQPVIELRRGDEVQSVLGLNDLPDVADREAIRQAVSFVVALALGLGLEVATLHASLIESARALSHQ
ncbi:MAG: hypothetical protein JNM56_17070 [Planctomycetia bacterium]|nr:hypothetical protein [Planctomycetia bacterium]